MLSALLTWTASVVSAHDGSMGRENHATGLTITDMMPYTAMTEAEAFAVKDSTKSGSDDATSKKEDKYKKEIEELKKEKKELETKVKELEQQIIKLTKEKDEFTAKNNELTAKNEELTASNQELTARIDELTASNQELTEKIAQLTARNNELEKELDELKAFKGRMIAELARNADSVWMKKSFAELLADDAAFEKAMKDYTDFADQDTTVAAAKEKMDALKQELAVYMNALKVLEEKFDKTKVKDALNEIDSLLAKTDVEGKKKELDEVRKKLDDYAAIVQLFQDMVKSFKESGKAAPEDTEYDYTMIEVLLKQQQDDDNITAYNSIPWLKGQFEEYLKKDDKAKKVTINEEVGEEILKIVTQ